MSAAGDYWGRVQHFAHSTNTDPDTNQPIDSWASGSNMWCYVVEAHVKQETQYGSLNHVVEADIHLRGFPDVAEKDKLLDLNTDRKYQIQGLIYDFSLVETLAHCYRIASLDD